MNKNMGSLLANLAFPGIIGITGLGVMAYGIYGKGPWIGLGFVLVATSFVTGVSWYGAARSVMEVSRVVEKPTTVSKVA